MTQYFAYGSNLLPTQMDMRCPDSQFLFNCQLEGYRFLIGERGYATLAEAPDDVVHGVLYSLSEEDERTLDRMEGVQIGCYNKEQVSVIDARGDHHVVLTYIDPRIAPAPPKDGYMEKILEGVHHYQLPPDYLTFLQGFLAKPV